MKQNRYLA